MLIWSGKGILSVLVLVVVFVISMAVLPDAALMYSFFISFLAAGAFSWFMGKKWNEKEGRTVIDKATGQEITLKPNHSLFWIKMQYWGVIFSIIGIIMLVFTIV